MRGYGGRRVWREGPRWREGAHDNQRGPKGTLSRERGPKGAKGDPKPLEGPPATKGRTNNNNSNL